MQDDTTNTYQNSKKNQSKQRKCTKYLSCRSCDVCSANPHIVTGRDKVGQGDNDDGEEGGDRERQLSHPERLLELPPATKVVLPERFKFS